MQREVNGIDVLTPERGVHDGGRKRVGDGISGTAVDAGGGVDGIDAVHAAQFLRSGLSGSGLFSSADRREGKYTAGANSEHPADDALFAHAQAHQRMVIAFALQELDHGNVVGERSGHAAFAVAPVYTLVPFEVRHRPVGSRWLRLWPGCQAEPR